MIRFSKLGQLLVLSTCASLAACGPDKSSPPKIEAPAPAHPIDGSTAPTAARPAPSGTIATTPNSSIPTFATLTSPPTTGAPIPTVVARTVDGGGPSGSNIPAARPNVADVIDARHRPSFSDAAFDIAGPLTEESRSRSDSLRRTRELNEQYRNLNPARLAESLKQSSPNAEAIKAVLRSRSTNDVIKRLSTFLTDADANRVAATGTLLVADIFSDADYASSKVAEVVLDLGVISQRGLYDEVVASRVAYLQSQIDQTSRYDKYRGYLKTALLVALPAGGSYYLAGRQARVLDKATGTIRSVRVGAILNDGQSGLKKTYSAALGVFNRGLASAKLAAAKLDLTPAEVVKQELRALGFAAEELNSYRITSISKSDVNYLANSYQGPLHVQPKFLPSGRDRVSYFVSDQFNGPIPDGKLMVILRIKRPLRPTEHVATGFLPADEATKLAERLRPNSSMTFISEVDAGGGTTQTMIRTEKLAGADDAAAGATRPRAFPIEPAPTAVEPVAAGPAPRAFRAESPAAADEVVTAPATGAANAADAEQITKDKVAFDHLRGALAAVGTLSLGGAYEIIGFLQGERNGRDLENTYLERQVDRTARPPETAVSDLNQR